MIIVRSPLRITLGGGGTDLPSYYQNHEGFLVSAAIDQYVYITLHQTFEQKLILKYSKMEKVNEAYEVEHPIIREALDLLEIKKPHLEITSMADIPAGTGLGSSGSFTTALLKALHTYKKNLIHPHKLAEQASHIEIDRLGEPVGKQDPYIAAYGGVTCFKFQKDNEVKVWPLTISEETLINLEDHLLLFYTHITRSSSELLKEQNDKTCSLNNEMIENLHFVKEKAQESALALELNNLDRFAHIMHEHWELKKKRSKNMSSPALNECYDFALKNGARSGKIVGAGGGGFFMFYASDKTKLRHALREKGLKEVRFRFDFQGTQTVVNG